MLYNGHYCELPCCRCIRNRISFRHCVHHHVCNCFSCCWSICYFCYLQCGFSLPPYSPLWSTRELPWRGLRPYRLFNGAALKEDCQRKIDGFLLQWHVVPRCKGSWICSAIKSVLWKPISSTCASVSLSSWRTPVQKSLNSTHIWSRSQRIHMCTSLLKILCFKTMMNLISSSYWGE